MFAKTQPRKSAIEQAVAEIRSSNAPLQEQETLLLALKDRAASIEEALFLQANADYVADVMANRNFEGARMEELLRPEQAIALYEANVQDRCKLTYPYERLLILYAASGRYQEAIRVCRHCLEFAPEAGSIKCREWMARYEGEAQ